MSHRLRVKRINIPIVVRQLQSSRNKLDFVVFGKALEILLQLSTNGYEPVRIEPVLRKVKVSTLSCYIDVAYTFYNMNNISVF